MDQGLVTFSTIPNDHIIGGEMTMSWGIEPSSAIITMIPMKTLPKAVGQLDFRFQGKVVSLKECAISPTTLRIHKFRKGHVWSVQIFDRRWRWRYPTISGEYNKRRCDGSLDPANKKTLKELLTLLFNALGESPFELTYIPDVFPYVNWSESRASLELGHLAERFGCAVMLKGDVPAVEAIGKGDNIGTTSHDLHSTYLYGLTVKPKRERVISGSTIIQQKLRLKAVGVEASGDREEIDLLSYLPSGGWESQWPTTLTDVPPDKRHNALDTVWRWFEIVPPESIAGVSIDSVKQIKLRTITAEIMEGSTGEFYCAPPRVKGTFYPYTMWPENVTDAWFPGPFEIDVEAQLVKFEYPVIMLDEENNPKEPILDLYTSFELTDPDGNPVVMESAANIPSVTYTTKDRVDRFDYLTATDIIDPAWESPTGGTASETQQELERIRDAIIGTYDGQEACDFWQEGLRAIKLSGKIAQIRWRCYADRAASTRASCHMEFDIHTKAYSEHRRQQRSNHLANRMLFS
jgi:hypothetical protein